jgi:uncharacterized protein (DUF1330 family)
MSAYVIVDVETSDPEKYEEYKRMAQESVARFGGRYVVRGGKFAVVEGDWRPTRLVILQFESFDRALEWWGSDDYSPAKELRQRLSRTDIVIVDGL